MFIIIFCFSTFIFSCYTSDVKGFDDTILFDIQWPGKKLNNELALTDDDHVIITTAYKEKYKCILPKLQDKETSYADNYEGPTPIELLAPLFSQTACSYRLESYWTYEVCHSRHIRQYHEDREGKKVKVQEYILGEWDKNQYNALVTELKSPANKNIPIPHKKIDGNDLPYFEVIMGNGTLCELNQNKPRMTKVLYVCFASGKHEVFSIKEISTCVYETIILSPLLCEHPKYKVPEMGENSINCLPLDDSLDKPRNLMKMVQEQNKLKHKTEDRVRVEFHHLDLNEKESLPKIPETNLGFNTLPVKRFLSGEECLIGGTGWWQYKFCYGKSVHQYHAEKDGIQTSINLGSFNIEKHLQWLVENPNKRPKPLGQRTHISHLYADGSMCDRTGKPRRTEVKLKCMQNLSTPTAVSLYLLEPKYCEYILGVESPLICDILDKADKDGLVKLEDDVEVTVIDVTPPNV